MTQEKKKYLTKTVSFGGSKMTLYSVDGNTWSSRLDELDLLQERFDNGGRLPVDATKGKQPFVIRKNKFAKRVSEDEPPSLDDYDETAVAIEDETLAGVVLDEELEDDALDDDVPSAKGLGKKGKKGEEVAGLSKSKASKAIDAPPKAQAVRSEGTKNSAKTAIIKVKPQKEGTPPGKGGGASNKDSGKGKEVTKAVTKTSTRSPAKPLKAAKGTPAKSNQTEKKLKTAKGVSTGKGSMKSKNIGKSKASSKGKGKRH